jgi:pimeloyl-ACP methyl ester carboxylesterase
MDNFESWITEWKRLADHVSLEAADYLGKGLDSSACCAFHRASNYYRMAEFYTNHKDPCQEELWNLGRKCFFEACKLNNPKIEPIGIPFEGVNLPGYFVKAGNGKAPTLIAMSGFDGSAEELCHMIGAVAPEQGWNCLIFEGPGQRGCLHLNPELKLRHDYEVPVKAVVDYAVTRDDVDADKLALIGYSLGGYFAPRAVAFEYRIKACVASSLLTDIGEAWLAVWPKFLTSRKKTFNPFFRLFSFFNKEMKWGYDHALWAMDIKTPYEFLRAWDSFSLKGLQKQIECPVVSIIGADEIEQTSQTVIDIILNWAKDTNVQYHLFDKESGAAAHCQIGNISQAHAVIFDWLNNTVLLNNDHYFPLLKDLKINKKRI